MQRMSIACLGLLIALGACESSATKLERLKLAEGRTGEIAWYRGTQLDSVRALGDTAKVRAYSDTLQKAQKTHDLAQRDLNRFIGGR